MFKNKDKGISPQIGVILMVAITLIAALGIAQFVLGLNLQDSVKTGVIIQETGNNTAEVVWDSNQNAEKINVKINSVTQDTFTNVGDSAKYSYSNGDTISAVGVTEDTSSVVASEKFRNGILENNESNSDFKLLASESNADGVLLIAGDITTEAESDVKFTINGEKFNPDGKTTINGIKFFKVYLNNYDGNQNYTVGAKPIGSTVYNSVEWKSSTDWYGDFGDPDGVDGVEHYYYNIGISEISGVTTDQYEAYMSADGLGTKNNPKQITTKKQFNGIIKSDSYINLQSNIDFSGEDIPPRIKKIDGKNYTLSNIDTSSTVFSGIIVKNIVFDDIDVSGGSESHIFIDSTVQDVDITNSTIEATLEEFSCVTSCTYNGRAGVSENSTLNNVSVTNTTITMNKGSYTSSYTSNDSVIAKIGGLCSINESSSTIQNSYFSGSISGYGIIGGVCGYNRGTVSNSYSQATVNVTDMLTGGGLVGDNYGSVEDSYAAGGLGVIGDNHSGATVTDLYWDTEASGISDSPYGTGLTTSEMQGSSAESNMTGFDFSSTWKTVSGDYPELQE